MKVAYQTRPVYWVALAGALCLVAAVGYHVIWGEHGYLALRQERQEYRELVRQTNQLEQENGSLKKSIDGLKNDRRTVEKKAREDLLMAKPGEIIIKYSPDSQAPDSAGSKAPTQTSAR